METLRDTSHFRNIGVCLRPMQRGSLSRWAATWRCTPTSGGGPWTSATSARRPWSIGMGLPLPEPTALAKLPWTDTLVGGTGSCYIVFACLFFKLYRWHFVTMGSNLDSIVIRRLKEEEPAFPFFSWFKLFEIYVKFCPAVVIYAILSRDNFCREFTHFWV